MKLQDMKFDINTMCEFEVLTGKSLIKVLQNTDELQMLDVRALVQTGLGLKSAEEAGNVLMEYVREEGNEPILTLLGNKLDETGMMDSKKKD